MTHQRSASQSWRQEHRTPLLFLATQMASVPFWALFALLPVILYKELEATPLQLALIIALKPLSALLSPYWSHLVGRGTNQLRNNLLWAHLFRYLPFLVLPWYGDVFFLIAAHTLFMAFKRAAIPSWMEVMKRNMQTGQSQKLFASVSALDYLCSAALPLLFGWLLDEYEGSWRYLFFATGLIGGASSLLYLYLPVEKSKDQAARVQEKLSFSLIGPWRSSYRLLLDRPDFALFQLGFMLCGTALMLIHVALPAFFVDQLHLSYGAISMAITSCKGIGFALSSPLWSKAFSRSSIFAFSSRVTLLATLFPLLILVSPWQLSALYGAYLLYGAMQAGSELGWNLSGPLFSGKEESLDYSNANILAVGLRGALLFLIGDPLYGLAGGQLLLVAAAALCGLATLTLASSSRRYAVAVIS